MSQSLDLGNTEVINFNDNPVEILQLNGVEIWGSFKKLGQLIDRSIESVTVEDLEGITSIGDYAFSYCEKLSTVQLPNTITQIGSEAFSNCKNVVDVLIPKGLETIGVKCFLNCENITEMVLPETTTSIGDSCFYNCSNLRRLTILATTPPALNGATPFVGTLLLDNVNNGIFVPSSAVETYKVHEDWDFYASYIKGV